jgi:hypothetical protein
LAAFSLTSRRKYSMMRFADTVPAAQAARTSAV